MTGEVTEGFRNAALEFVSEVVKNSIVYTEYNKRITVNLQDVLHALKVMGRPIYGYGM